jgi:CheY-like chemotaxis protein
MAVVLVAEDDPDVSLALTIILRRAGHAVLAAADGVAAFELARECRPELVLTDLDMPGMTGLDLCRAVRLDPVLRDTPVVIVSGSLRHGDPRAAQVRACGVLLKPFANDELVGIVERLLAEGPHGHGEPDAGAPLPEVYVGQVAPA